MTTATIKRFKAPTSSWADYIYKTYINGKPLRFQGNVIETFTRRQAIKIAMSERGVKVDKIYQAWNNRTYTV